MIKGLRFKAAILLLIIFSGPIRNPNTIALANTSTSSSSVTASASATVLQKFEAWKQELASKAAQFKSEVIKGMQNKLSAGQIQEKLDGKLTIVGRNGPITILVNEYTAVSLKPQSSGALSDISKGDFIAALGDMDGTTLVAKKIVKMKPSQQTVRSLIWGQVQDVSGTKITVTGKDKKNEVIETSPKTTFTAKDGETTLSSVKKGGVVILRVEKGPGKNVAKYIYIK